MVRKTMRELELLDWLFSRHNYDKSGSKSSADREFELINEKDIFLDVGAFHGYTTIRVAKIVDKVIAVEAYKKNFLTLVENIVKHKLTNVLPLCIAGWNRKDTLQVRQPSRGNNSMSVKWGGREECDVLALSLDDVLKFWKLQPTFIRIDCCGSEVEILEGLKQTLKEQPTTIVISIGDNVQKVFNLMESFGYNGEQIEKTNAYLFRG